MNVTSNAPRRYRIVFRGECGDGFAGVFSRAMIESRHGYTWVVAEVRDGSEFYGLLDRFQDLGLAPVSIDELDADCTGLRSVSRSSRSRPESADVDTMTWLAEMMAGDPAAVTMADGQVTRDIEAITLDARSQALIRLAGLAACGGEPAAVYDQVMSAIRHGVSPDEIIAALVVLLPMAGADRLTAAASAVRHVLSEPAHRGLIAGARDGIRYTEPDQADATGASLPG